MSFVLLRLALAFSFLYPAYGFWKHADNWTGYIPPFVHGLGIAEPVLLGLLAVFHLALAFWILSGWRIVTPSLIAAAFLGSVVFFNLNQLDIFFRDISLALAALALAFDSGVRG